MKNVVAKPYDPVRLDSRWKRLVGDPQIVASILVGCVGLIAPMLMYPVFATKILCLGIFAMGFNLLLGQAGLLSFGHAMFFGGGAYVTAYALKTLALPSAVAILLGVAFATVCGLLVGLVAIRRQGIYFAMITLALSQMFFYLCVSVPQTGGDDGISAVPVPALFGLIDLRNDMHLYYTIFAIAIAVYLILFRITHSPFGQAMRAIRDNETRAISLGYKVNRYKLLTFVMSAAVAGLAGALKVLVFRLVTLVDVNWSTSGDVIFMTLMGGVGTLLGPVVGAGFLLTLGNVLEGASQWIQVIEGTVFMILVLVLPRGFVGEMMFRFAGKAKANSNSAEKDV